MTGRGFIAREGQRERDKEGQVRGDHSEEPERSKRRKRRREREGRAHRRDTRE